MTIISSGYAKQRNVDSSQRARNRKAIRAQGATVCGICLQPITATDTTEVDHIIPVADGGTHDLHNRGTHDLHNLRLVHKTCNRRRGGGGGQHATQEPPA